MDVASDRLSGEELFAGQTAAQFLNRISASDLMRWHHRSRHHAPSAAGAVLPEHEGRLRTRAAARQHVASAATALGSGASERCPRPKRSVDAAGQPRNEVLVENQRQDEDRQHREVRERDSSISGFLCEPSALGDGKGCHAIRRMEELPARFGLKGNRKLCAIEVGCVWSPAPSIGRRQKHGW